MILASFGIILSLAFQQQTASPTQVAREIVLRPESVTVGAPFEVTVRVSAPAGSVIRFPTAADSTAAVRMLDPVVVTTIDSLGGNVQTATYRMAAWDVGAQPVNLGSVLVRDTVGGAFRPLELNVPSVTVVSVLPADSTLRVPKPARDLIGIPPAWWYPWLPLLVLSALLLAIFRWWYRRRGSRPMVLPVARDLARTEREFARIESMHLIEAGEHGRFVVLMVDVLREFFATHFAIATASQTSAELLAAIDREREEVPSGRIAVLLYEADQVKFAGRKISAAHAQHLGLEAREIVRAIGERPLPADDEGQKQEDAA